MKYAVKVLCFVAVCAAVGYYLYSHMHADYSLKSKNINNSNMELEDKSKTPFKCPDSFKKVVSPLLTFDVKVTTSEAFLAQNSQTFLCAKAVREPVNSQTVFSYFMGNSKQVSSNKYENYLDSEGKLTPIMVYNEKDTQLSVSARDFNYFQSPKGNYILNSFYPNETVETYNANLYSKTADLDFMSREDAWLRLKETMECVGIPMSTSVRQAVYSLDMETMKQEESCIDVNGNEMTQEKNPSWSKADEGYYYYITQSYQGIPFYSSSKLETDDLNVAPLEVYQAESGLYRASLKRWFSIEQEEDVLEFAPFERVMQTIEEKYSGTLHTNPLTVEKAQLYIFPIKTEEEGYTLAPVWVCSIAEKHTDLGADAYTSYIYMPIHAITGDEMLLLENGS